MSQCEHANASTPYCPYCGDALAQSPFAELRNYIAAQLRRFNKVSEKLQERIDNNLVDNFDSIDRMRERLLSTQKTVNKWSSWMALLDERAEAAS